MEPKAWIVSVTAVGTTPSTFAVAESDTSLVTVTKSSSTKSPWSTE